MHPTLQMTQKCSNETLQDTILRARFGRAVFQNSYGGVGYTENYKSTRTSATKTRRANGCFQGRQLSAAATSFRGI